jgi:hypothetical protein
MMVRARCSEEDQTVSHPETSVAIEIKRERAYVIDWSLVVVFVKQQTASSSRKKDVLIWHQPLKEPCQDGLWVQDLDLVRGVSFGGGLIAAGLVQNDRDRHLSVNQ